ncbi:hypothetical protein AX774_g2686 [Zancudomyces culisetae]|uniref:Uncharacterized protein n=1 Tax=Zancudomyces culisetae TaxID=1213189 RepID=A0A1R1PS75_ZANCU|nr:hypothetical protein AX774_g2686 [Zancudomyces culisetae]|eukprot:OMH83804.1 hypothetical protein AX774_g2686 [Zancudomyces culisetae]
MNNALLNAKRFCRPGLQAGNLFKLGHISPSLARFPKPTFPINCGIGTKNYSSFALRFSNIFSKNPILLKNTASIENNGITMTRIMKQNRNSGKRSYSSNPKDNAEPKKKQSKIRTLITEYGIIALLGYSIVGTIDLGLSIAFIYWNGDEFVSKLNDLLIKYVPILAPSSSSESDMSKDSNGSFMSRLDPKLTVIIVSGYALHKLLMPLRLVIVAALCPPAARYAKRMGWNWLIRSKKKIN